MLNDMVEIQLPTKNAKDQFVAECAVGRLKTLFVAGQKNGGMNAVLNLPQNLKCDPARW
jgi:hypothetical protein